MQWHNDKWQLKFRYRIWLDISPKKIHKWLIKIWKDAHHYDADQTHKRYHFILRYENHLLKKWKMASVGWDV